MADRSDQRDHARSRRAHHDLLVERPQILERTAAARDDEEIGPAHRSVEGERVEAVDRGGDLLGAAIALYAHRPHDHVARKAVGEPMQNIADHGTRRRGHDADPLRQEREQLLARGLEQAFGGEFFLALLDKRHQRPDARRRERLDDDLVCRLAGISRQPAGDENFEPFLGLDAHARQRAPPDHRVDLGAFVLEREIAVAGGVRPAKAGNLAAHAHVAKGVLDGLFQRRRELGDGPFRDVEARWLVHDARR